MTTRKQPAKALAVKALAVKALAKGQVWKTENAYIQIVELGKRLIQYKMMKQQGQKAVKTQMAGIDSLETYLKTNAAKLVS